MSDSNNQIMKKNKKAQIGETLTWIVATLIILGVLLIFIYASLALAKAKSVNSLKVKDHINSFPRGLEENWIETKNEMAFTRNSQNKQAILDWIKEKQLNEEEGLFKEVLENENQ
jgi:hypothetical protein